jgi:hypothetical protein
LGDISLGAAFLPALRAAAGGGIIDHARASNSKLSPVRKMSVRGPWTDGRINRLFRKVPYEK